MFAGNIKYRKSIYDTTGERRKEKRRKEKMRVEKWLRWFHAWETFECNFLKIINYFYSIFFCRTCINNRNTCTHTQTRVRMCVCSSMIVCLGGIAYISALIFFKFVTAVSRNHASLLSWHVETVYIVFVGCDTDYNCSFHRLLTNIVFSIKNTKTIFINFPCISTFTVLYNTEDLC